MTYSWAGVMLITADNKIIAMHRDDKPGIRDPGCYGIFGGAIEDGEEPLEAAVREINEETSLRVKKDDLELFKTYNQKRDYLDKPGTLYVYVIRNVNPRTLKTYEGQGIKVLDDDKDGNIAGDIHEAFTDWFTRQSIINL